MSLMATRSGKVNKGKKKRPNPKFPCKYCGEPTSRSNQYRHYDSIKCTEYREAQREEERTRENEVKLVLDTILLRLECNLSVASSSGAGNPFSEGACHNEKWPLISELLSYSEEDLQLATLYLKTLKACREGDDLSKMGSNTHDFRDMLHVWERDKIDSKENSCVAEWAARFTNSANRKPPKEVPILVSCDVNAFDDEVVLCSFATVESSTYGVGKEFRSIVDLNHLLCVPQYTEKVLADRCRALLAKLQAWSTAYMLYLKDKQNSTLSHAEMQRCEYPEYIGIREEPNIRKFGRHPPKAMEPVIEYITHCLFRQSRHVKNFNLQENLNRQLSAFPHCQFPADIRERITRKLQLHLIS